MGAFQRKFTDEQRAAFVKAVLDAELPQKQVRDMAAIGALDDLEPFHVPPSTGYEWVQVERLKRAGEQVKGTPELSTVLLDQARRLTVINERKIRRLEALDRANKDVPITQVKACAAIVRTLAFAQPRGQRHKGETTPRPDPETEQPDLIQKLATAQANNATNNNDTQPTTTTPAKPEHQDKNDTNPRFVAASEDGGSARARLTSAG